MGETFIGSVTIKDSPDGDTRINLNGFTSNISIRDRNRKLRTEFKYSETVFRNSEEKVWLKIGKPLRRPHEIIFSHNNKKSLTLNESGEIINYYNNGKKSFETLPYYQSTFFRDKNEKYRIVHYHDKGEIALFDSRQRKQIALESQLSPIIRFYDPNGKERMKIGEKGRGTVEKHAIQASYPNGSKAIDLHIGKGASGLRLQSKNNKNSVSVYSQSLTYKDSDGKESLYFSSNQGTIRTSYNGKKSFVIDSANRKILTFNDSQKQTMEINGQQGDIIMTNADCAEEYSTVDPKGTEPGTVMIIESKTKLRPSYKEYDKKVAGVVSGAGSLKPGIVLGKSTNSQNGIPLALIGRTYCKVDAQYSPIEMGDLLTTSPTKGYAMKADDPVKAFGAVIGKALGEIKKGADLIPIMVALQ